MLKASHGEFERIVWEALECLPPAVRGRANNLEIEVKRAPSPDDLGVRLWMFA